MKLIAKKDLFINNKGAKKTRVFKKGNIYTIENVLSHTLNNSHPWKSYKVTDDTGGSYWYDESEIKKLFSNLNRSRDNKLEELGIV
jgi:hypothetical protein